MPRPPRSTLFPYTTLFRSARFNQRFAGQAEQPVQVFGRESHHAFRHFCLLSAGGEKTEVTERVVRLTAENLNRLLGLAGESLVESRRSEERRVGKECRSGGARHILEKQSRRGGAGAGEWEDV